MATRLLDLQQSTPEQKHRLYTDHAPEALAEAEEALAGPERVPVLVLSGPPGCGRTGFLKAAAHGAGLRGKRVSVLPLDFDGYEEGLDLTRFAEVQIAGRWDLEAGARETLREQVLPFLAFVPSTLAGAALVSLLLRQENPAEVWKTLPDTAPGDARPALSSLFERLGRESLLVVHAVDSAQLNNPLRRWLLEEARRNPALVLALSCSPAEPADRLLAPGVSGVRIDLEPLPTEGLLEPVKELLDDLDIETSDRLQRFLDLAALCGPNLPAEVLFHHLELEEEQKEELLDVIDEDLVEDEGARIFVDHQYGHPAFPGLLTYAFLDPRINHAILEPLPEGKRQRLASELLDFLNRSVPIHTRGMTLLRLALARHLEDEAASQFFLREMRVWIGESEAEDLAADLADGLAAGRMSARDLLGTAAQTSEHWPAHRRLAFLDTVRRHPGDLAPAERLELHNLLAEALRDLKRPEEALEEAGLSLEQATALHGAEHPATARALNLQGILLREMGRPQEAREPLERALATQDRTKADPNLASILANLGMVLRDLGQREAARDHLEQALAIHRQVFGDSHPAVAADLNHLAVLAREMGQPERALDYLRPVVDIVRNLHGDVHPETARALTNVAGLLREVGEGEGARLHLEAALQIDQQALGESHPQVVADLNNLAVIEQELGHTEEAREHFEQALALSRAALGEDHPLTAQLRRAAAE
ncbi:MAG TPA: tetratricopeptide repeat protein [Thermoanaerobaculia bacterium]|jgi:tetratricopeptide (TPR) repeat protein|nr:tetratricopeptide repeat protein [Thermoanaerobaculia bacterium]